MRLSANLRTIFLSRDQASLSWLFTVSRENVRLHTRRCLSEGASEQGVHSAGWMCFQVTVFFKYNRDCWKIWMSIPNDLEIFRRIIIVYQMVLIGDGWLFLSSASAPFSLCIALPFVIHVLERIYHHISVWNGTLKSKTVLIVHNICRVLANVLKSLL